MNHQLRTIFHSLNHNQTYTISLLKTLNPIHPRGKLTLIPTPIGNINDLSPNIIRALFSADLIGCEDRRMAGKLYSLIKNRKVL